jgi:chemotaxis protein CheC
VSSSAPSEAQFDALREVANVGCGHAANALSRLVGGRTVRIDVPRVVLTPPAGIPQLLGGAGATVVATSLEILGELNGRLLLILQEGEARRLSMELLSRPKQSLIDAELRALEEAGNIVACACLNAIAAFSGLRLLPSTPSVCRASAEEVVHQAVQDLEPEAGMVMVLEASFSTCSAPTLSGQLLVLPHRHSVQVLLAKLGV